MTLKLAGLHDCFDTTAVGKLSRRRRSTVKPEHKVYSQRIVNTIRQQFS